MICLTKLFQQKRRRIGYILAFSDPTISKRDSSDSKHENVLGAFDIEDDIVKGKTILLIDDIYDSGATLKEVGSILTQKGAKYIVPIVIAKTVGGTL